ncbi:MAG TPA: hypothetical protein VK485_09665 [Sphingomicrobium sp.]|nr:hypothetical protein [Sphingomicrobium sp.]
MHDANSNRESLDRKANRSANDFARLWRTADRDFRLALVENQLRAA